MSTVRVVILPLALALGACTPKSPVEQQVELVREEQTADKLLGRGKAFAQVGDYTRAEQYLAAAIDAGAPVGEALPLLMRVCIAEKRYRAAINHGMPHLNKQPDDYKLRFVLGSLYATIGDSAMAWEHLKKVAEDQPEHAEVQFAMGMLALEADGDIVTADGHFREYLRLEPNGAHAAEARSHLLRSMP